jgi:uncharacterized protein YycO
MVRRLKRGDIILVHYNFDLAGWLIRLYTHSYWNHASWVMDSKHLIESKRKGIIISPINKYNNNFLFKTKIVRIKKISNIKLNKAIRLAVQQRKITPYWKQIITFTFLLFDYEGRLPKPTCSGLIAQCLYKVGIKFCSKRPSRVTPADINESEIVKEI